MSAVDRARFEGKLRLNEMVFATHNVSSFQHLAVIDILDEASSLEEEFKNVKFVYKKCSVTDEQELRKCMTQIRDSLGWVDVIVNSVGVLDETSPKRTIDINYVGIPMFFFLSFAVIK